MLHNSALGYCISLGLSTDACPLLVGTHRYLFFKSMVSFFIAQESVTSAPCFKTNN